MKIKYFVLISLILTISASAALGSQIIRFKTGSCLVAQDHRIEGKMIYITLEKGNEVGFPMSLVDKIEDRAEQTLYNKPLFLKKNSPGSGKVLSTDNSRFPPGFTSELDSLAKYRTNKTEKAKEGILPGLFTGPRIVNSKNRLKSVSSAASIGSTRGTTTQSFQSGQKRITIKTARTRASGKPQGGGQLQPKVPK